MSSSTRPTLPSIHSLGLLPTSEDTMYQWNNDNTSTNHSKYSRMARRGSTSSLTDSDIEGLRSPSPSSSSSSSTPPPPSPPTFNVPEMIASGARVRFTPCQLNEADALMLFPPSISPSAPSKPVMLFAPAVNQILRHPERLLSKGARVHPYRMRCVLPTREQRRSRSSK